MLLPMCNRYEVFFPPNRLFFRILSVLVYVCASRSRSCIYCCWTLSSFFSYPSSSSFPRINAHYKLNSLSDNCSTDDFEANVQITQSPKISWKRSKSLRIAARGFSRYIVCFRSMKIGWLLGFSMWFDHL